MGIDDSDGGRVRQRNIIGKNGGDKGKNQDNDNHNNDRKSSTKNISKNVRIPLAHSLDCVIPPLPPPPIDPRYSCEGRRGESAEVADMDADDSCEMVMMAMATAAGTRFEEEQDEVKGGRGDSAFLHHNDNHLLQNQHNQNQRRFPFPPRNTVAERSNCNSNSND